jgi:hypothetical protein
LRVENRRGGKIDNSVAQKLQALVIGLGKTAMRESEIQQLWITE